MFFSGKRFATPTAEIIIIKSQITDTAISTGSDIKTILVSICNESKSTYDSSSNISIAKNNVSNRK